MSQANALEHDSVTALVLALHVSLLSNKSPKNFVSSLNITESYSILSGSGKRPLIRWKLTPKF